VLSELDFEVTGGSAVHYCLKGIELL